MFRRSTDDNAVVSFPHSSIASCKVTHMKAAEGSVIGSLQLFHSQSMVQFPSRSLQNRDISVHELPRLVQLLP